MTGTAPAEEPADGRRSGAGFLGAAPAGDGARRLFDEDMEQHGFVMNVSRLWAHLPDANGRLFELIGSVAGTGASR